MTGVTQSVQPLFALSCPLVCAVLICLFGKRPNIREGCTLAAASLQFVLVITMAPAILDGTILRSHILTICQGIDLSYRVDPLGLIFAITSSFLWILVSCYSIGYMRALNEHAQTRYYFMFALAIFSAVSIAFSENLITFYIFYEALTLSTYWLVAHHEDQEALAGARKYLSYLLLSGWFLFAAVVLTYSIAGTTEFRNGGILSVASAPEATLMILFLLFALGSMKAAWMPFHSWLPSAMVAPTPVSSLLHAVAVVKAGVFGFVRIVCHVYGIDLMRDLGLGLMLGSAASFTMIVASLFAIGEDNLKRRLAYSTISQLSYILFGVALLTASGIKGAIVHIPFHGFMKITLFLCAGAIMVMTGKKQISRLGGVAKQMPVTMAAFTIGALGMCGVPPVAGFVSKWFLCLGTAESGYFIFLGVILISSLLDVIYFFPIVKAAYFEKADIGNGEQIVNREKGRPIYMFMVIPLAITGFFSLLFCFFPRMFYILDLAELTVGKIMGK